MLGLGLVAPLVDVTPTRAAVLLVGACDFGSLLTSFSPALPDPTPPTDVIVPTTLTVSGSGTCDFVGDPTTYNATLGGNLTFLLPFIPHYTCAGGVAKGILSLDIDEVPGGLQSFSGETALVTTPVAAVVGFTSPLPVPRQYSGVGVFTKMSTDTTTCAASGLASTTWSGKLVFEDPEVPV